jgi:hypothetical protein
MTPREERKLRAERAVEAIVRRDAGVWERYRDNQQRQKAKKLLPGRIAKTRERLAQLEAEARALGVLA